MEKENKKKIIVEYLKEKKAEKKLKEKAQEDAEIEAEEILEEKGFKKVFRFNSVWFLKSGYKPYDYYAEKDGRWLVRVSSIGKKIDLRDDKYSRKFRVYRIGSLHKKENGEWMFTEIKEWESTEIGEGLE